MPRRRLALAFAIAAQALAAQPALAQDGDALKTPECRQALGELHQQEAAVQAARQADGTPDGDRTRAARGRLKTLADQAARACLRASPDRPVPQGRMAQPPVAVPPSPAAGPPRPTAPTRAAAPPALPRVDAPVTLTSCDLTGCWASDGTRLQKIGPNQLLGPRGFCSTAGGAVSCP
jgi:hypothetical protein